MSLQKLLIAYDVSSPARLRRVAASVKAWKASGQKSVAQCWLTPAQREALGRRLVSQIDQDRDRLAMLRLDPRQTILMFGRASQPADGSFIIV